LTTFLGDAGKASRLSRTVDAWPTSRLGADSRIVVAGLVIGGAIVAGMGWNIPLLTTVASLAAVVSALVAPAVGLATIAFMGPLAPPLVIPAPGFNLVLVGAVLLGCVYRLPIDRQRISLTTPVLLLLGFVLYVGVSQTPEMIAGYGPPGSVGYLSYSTFRELLTGVGTVLAAAYLLSRRSPFPFLAVALVSATLSAVLAIATTVNPLVGPPIAGLIAPENVQRGIGSFGNPNYFGVFEGIAIVTAVGLVSGIHSARLRWALASTCVVLAAGLALSLSRGALIAFAAGLACLVLSRSRARTSLAVAAGLLVAGIVLYPIFIESRLSTTNGSVSASSYAALTQSDASRVSAMLVGPQLFLTSPIFGIGWAHYASMSVWFAGPDLVAHDWYLQVLAEEGTVGILLTILLLVAIVTALRSRPTLARSIGFGVLGVYAVGSLFLEAPTSFQTSVLGILVIVAALTSDWTWPLGASGPPTSEGLPAPLSSGLMAAHRKTVSRHMLLGGNTKDRTDGP
jgi:O-antigen ligase